MITNCLVPRLLFSYFYLPTLLHSFVSFLSPFLTYFLPTSSHLPPPFLVSLSPSLSLTLSLSLSPLPYITLSLYPLLSQFTSFLPHSLSPSLFSLLPPLSLTLFFFLLFLSVKDHGAYLFQYFTRGVQMKL